MEILILFIGLLIGIMLHNILKVLKVFLCMISTYKWFDYKHPSTLPSLESLDFKYLLFKFPYPLEAIIVFSSCMLVFYWIIKLLLQKYVTTIAENKN